MKTYLRFLACCLLFAFKLSAQTADSSEPKSKWQYLLLADFYYGYDFGLPSTLLRQEAFCSYNRHNLPALNAGIAKVSYQSDRFRFHLGAVGGTYSTDNYAAEPGLLKHLFEGQIGLKLTKQKDLWLQLGAFPSHIGFESALASDNHTLSRSLLAENSPYFLSGAQLRYNHLQNWQFALLLINGWQRLRWRTDQRIPSFGTQIARQTDRWQWNWSSFTGMFDPDSLQRWRTFHNFYLIYHPQPKVWLTFGYDVGWQQQISRWASWYSPVLIARYQPTARWAMAGRAEYFHDPKAAHLRFSMPNGFRAWGLSANIDRQLGKSGLCRAELRYLNSPNAALNPNSNNQRQNLTALLSLVVRLEDDFRLPGH